MYAFQDAAYSVFMNNKCSERLMQKKHSPFAPYYLRAQLVRMVQPEVVRELILASECQLFDP